MKTEKRLQELGIELKAPPTPIANYVNAVRTGNLLYLAGKGPGPIKGRLGESMSVEDGYKAARATGVSLIQVMKAELGDLDRVVRIVKVLGMVNCTPEFGEQPKVINGCSDLFVEVFGERGKHARSAVGMGGLPNQIPVEVEVIVEVSDPPRRTAAAKRPAARKAAPKAKAKKKAAKKKR